MSSIDDLQVEISILIGKARVPVHKLLRMGRGAIINLDTHKNDEVTVLANNMPVARGQVMTNRGEISVSITKVFHAHPSLKKHMHFYHLTRLSANS